MYITFFFQLCVIVTIVLCEKISNFLLFFFVSPKKKKNNVSTFSFFKIQSSTFYVDGIFPFSIFFFSILFVWGLERKNVYLYTLSKKSVYMCYVMFVLCFTLNERKKKGYFLVLHYMYMDIRFGISISFSVTVLNFFFSAFPFDYLSVHNMVCIM